MVIITPISKNFVKSINSDEIQILRKINFGKNTYSFYHFFAKVFYVQKIQHLSVKATFFLKEVTKYCVDFTEFFEYGRDLVLLYFYTHSVELQKYSLTLFSQKFRESNVFTKEVTNDLI